MPPAGPYSVVQQSSLSMVSMLEAHEGGKSTAALSLLQVQGSELHASYLRATVNNAMTHRIRNWHTAALNRS